MSNNIPSTSVGNVLVASLKKNWGHAFAVPVAVTVPRGAVRGCGGFRRRERVGGFAKGIPLKDSTEVPVEPIMVAAG